MLDIVDIEFHLISKRVLISTMDLCHPRDPRLHREYLILILLIVFDFTRLMGSWSDE
jgi:hypothetical protein